MPGVEGSSGVGVSDRTETVEVGQCPSAPRRRALREQPIPHFSDATDQPARPRRSVPRQAGAGRLRGLVSLRAAAPAPDVQTQASISVTPFMQPNLSLHGSLPDGTALMSRADAESLGTPVTVSMPKLVLPAPAPKFRLIDPLKASTRPR